MALPKFGTSGRPVFASSGRPAFSCATGQTCRRALVCGTNAQSNVWVCGTIPGDIFTPYVFRVAGVCHFVTPSFPLAVPPANAIIVQAEAVSPYVSCTACIPPVSDACCNPTALPSAVTVSVSGFNPCVCEATNATCRPSTGPSGSFVLPRLQTPACSYGIFRQGAFTVEHCDTNPLCPCPGTPGTIEYFVEASRSSTRAGIRMIGDVCSTFLFASQTVPQTICDGASVTIPFNASAFGCNPGQNGFTSGSIIVSPAGGFGPEDFA